MGDDLVAVEIEVDPVLGAAPFGAAQQLAVEAARGGQIVDRKGEMEGRQGHAFELFEQARSRRNQRKLGALVGKAGGRR